MNRQENKIIDLGKKYPKIFAKDLREVTNDTESYILIFSQDDKIYKVYMSIEDMDMLKKTSYKEKEINMKRFVDNIFIITKNNEEKLTGDRN